MTNHLKMNTKTRISMGDINGLIAKAIDTDNAVLAGQVAEILREHGMHYHDILRAAQAVRPGLDEAAWESLMFNSEGPE